MWQEFGHRIGVFVVWHQYTESQNRTILNLIGILGFAMTGEEGFDGDV
jgi:hypothetical protein